MTDQHTRHQALRVALAAEVADALEIARVANLEGNVAEVGVAIQAAIAHLSALRSPAVSYDQLAQPPLTAPVPPPHRYDGPT